MVRDGDWLMSKVQIMHGAYGIVPPDLDGAVASGSYFSFRAKPVLHLPFLWYLSHLPAFHLSCDVSSVGVVIEKMVFRVDDWMGFELPLPPLPAQRKIAAILSSVDDAIEATQAVIDQVQVVKKAMMAELLTRGIPGRHTKFVKTAIGEIPETWAVVSLRDVARVRGGKRMPKGRPFAPGTTAYPYIRVSDLVDGTVAPDGLKYVQPEDRQGIRNYTIAVDDLYISIAGTLGLVGELPADLDGAQLTENAAKITGINRTRLDKAYLMYVLQGDHCQAQIGRAKGVGAGVPKLALFRIESIRIPVPRIDEQREVSAAIRGLVLRTRCETEVLEAWRLLKKNLSRVLLTGEVRVQPDEDAA